MEKQEFHLIAESFVNQAYNTQPERFLEEMRRMHPTSQQLFAGLVLKWMKDYAENYNQDDRNKSSIQYVRKVVEAYEINSGEQLRTGFPII